MNLNVQTTKSMQATAAVSVLGGPRQPGQQSPPLIHHAFQVSMSAPLPPFTRAHGRELWLSIIHSPGPKPPGHEPATRVCIQWVGRAKEGLFFLHRTKGGKAARLCQLELKVPRVLMAF